MVPGGNVNYSRGISEHIYEEKHTVQQHYSWFTSLPITEGDNDHPLLFFKNSDAGISWYSLNRVYMNGYINGTNLLFL